LSLQGLTETGARDVYSSQGNSVGNRGPDVNLLSVDVCRFLGDPISLDRPRGSRVL